jgi:hypothetical protein
VPSEEGNTDNYPDHVDGRYSITSLARSRKDSGIARPSALVPARHASDVATRAIERGDKAILDGIATVSKYDRNYRRGRLGYLGRHCAAIGENHVHPAIDQIGSE